MPHSSPHYDLIAGPLDTVIVGSRVLVLEQTESTNDLALRLGGDGTVVVTDHQTAGRGRHGKSWHSAAGLGLWFSVSLEGNVEGLPFAAPLAVRDALRPWCRVDIKWPNDLLFDGKKLGGILIEQRGQRTALGIGINVLHSPEDFPEDVRTTATSIQSASTKPCNRSHVLKALLTALDEKIMVMRSGKIDALHRDWAAACNVQGRRVRAGAVDGAVESIDQTGALIVRTNEGVQRILFGEGVEISEA
jgi:BirA family biotin operon repressor/biotin-[acetyl-CoA-carboxylase] ligase